MCHERSCNFRRIFCEPHFRETFAPGRPAVYLFALPRHVARDTHSSTINHQQQCRRRGRYRSTSRIVAHVHCSCLVNRRHTRALLLTNPSMHGHPRKHLWTTCAFISPSRKLLTRRTFELSTFKRSSSLPCSPQVVIVSMPAANLRLSSDSCTCFY